MLLFLFLLVNNNNIDPDREFLMYMAEIISIKAFEPEYLSYVTAATIYQNGDYLPSRLCDIFVYMKDHPQTDMNPVKFRWLYESVPNTSIRERYTYLISFYGDYISRYDQKRFYKLLREMDLLDGLYDFKLPSGYEGLMKIAYEENQYPQMYRFAVRGAQEWVWEPSLIQIDYYDIPDVLKFRPNFDKVLKWVNRNIKYKADPNQTDYHQTPIETLDRRTGDCEDFSILVIAICDKLKIKVDLVAGRVWDEYGSYGHAWVSYEGKFYDPVQTDGKFKFQTMPRFYVIIPAKGKKLD